jgi:hypothetical protein
MTKVNRNLGVESTAENLDVHANTLRGWCRRKPVPCPHTRTKAGLLLFDPGECAAWMKSQGLTGEVGRPSEASPALKDAKLRHLTAMAQVWEQRAAKERGEMISRAEVEAGNVARILAVKAEMMEVAKRGHLIANKTTAECDALLESWMRSICDKFAGQSPGAEG